MIHACTIDVEDYYQVSAFERHVPRERWDSMASRVVASTETVLEILGAAGVRGTFFVLGRVAQRHPELVRRIADAGHELACHSHEHRLVYELTPDEFRADLRAAKALVEDLAGVAVTAYRAPSFSITGRSLWALDILAEEGFAVDSSVFPVANHDRYGLPGAPMAPYRVRTAAGELTEFPPTAVRLRGRAFPAVGGGYFRLYPYSLTRWAVRQVAAEGRPANLYLHPWEFDPAQPRIAGIGWKTRFRHYVGLRRTAGRLARLLRDFRFGTLTDALAGAPLGPTLAPRAGRLVPAELPAEAAA